MTFPGLLEVSAVIAAGLVFGSFATALIHRVPLGKSWSGRERSACIYCKKNLKALDLIPLFSWFFLKGKCRYCGQKTGAVYPLTELAAAFSCLGIYAVWGFTAPAAILMLAVPFLLALLVIDLRHLILPDQLVFISGVLAVFFIGFQVLAVGVEGGILSLLSSHFLGAALFSGVIWAASAVTGRVLKKDTLGFGDVKFMAVAGLWLGAPWLPFMLICAGGAGILFGGFYRIVYKNPVFPFGPSLIISLYVSFILKGMGYIPFWAGY